MFSLVVIPSNLKECFSESGRTLALVKQWSHLYLEHQFKAPLSCFVFVCLFLGYKFSVDEHMDRFSTCLSLLATTAKCLRAKMSWKPMGIGGCFFFCCCLMFYFVLEYSEGTQAYIYMNPCFPKLSSYPGCHITLSRVPYAIQKVLAGYPFKI